MAVSTGFDLLVPKYILGTDWVGSVADQVIGAQHRLPNQLARFFPFYSIAASDKIVVPRVDTPSTAAFLGNSTSTTDDSDPTLDSPAEEFEITSIVGDVRLTDYSKDVESYSVDQLKLQIDLKRIAVEITFWNQFFRPQAGAGFEGLPDLVDATQQIEPGPNGGPLTLDGMDALVALVTEGQSEMDNKVLVMNNETFKKYRGLVRGTGGPLEYTTRTASPGMTYAAHNGVAILISDYVPNNENLGTGTNLTSIYCCTLGYQLNGLFGVVPPGVGQDGLIIEKAQTAERTDVCVYRIKWYVTLALGQIKGLARFRGIA